MVVRVAILMQNEEPIRVHVGMQVEFDLDLYPMYFVQDTVEGEAFRIVGDFIEPHMKRMLAEQEEAKNVVVRNLAVCSQPSEFQLRLEL